MRDKFISPKELMKFSVRLFENQWQKAANILSGHARGSRLRTTLGLPTDPPQAGFAKAKMIKAGSIRP